MKPHLIPEMVLEPPNLIELTSSADYRMLLLAVIRNAFPLSTPLRAAEAYLLHYPERTSALAKL